WECPGFRSIGTCFAYRIESASLKAMILSRLRRSFAVRCPKKCGPWRQTCRFSMAAACVARSHCARIAWCGTTAFFTSLSSPKKENARQHRRKPERRAVNRAEFERLLVEAVALIPKRFRREIKNLALVVEDAPSARLRREMGIEPPDSLVGLYQGPPLAERTWQYGNQLPDRITLFQQPIEEDCEDEDNVRAVIGETLIHEVGHYFGMSEEEIEDIEERYWRGETLVEDED